MPEISRFYGIVAKMYFLGRDHNPPHVHFIYNDCMSSVNLKDLTFMEGDLPAKARSLAMEWTKMYQRELLEMWDTQKFRTLPPLE